MQDRDTQVETMVSHDPITNTTVKRQNVRKGSSLPDDEFALAKVNQVIWYLTHIVAVLLAIRVLLLLLGANARGIVMFLYDITDIFVAPFVGVFPAPSEGGSYFDTAGILAVGFYYLLAFIITTFLRLLSKRNVEEL
jgi:hypothetical protein